MSEDEESSHLADTAFENGYLFVTEFEECGNDVDTFLHRDSYIPVRSTSVDLFEQEFCLSITKDIDGVVIEWEDISGISSEVSHFQVTPRRHTPLINMYGILKKHVNLRNYTDAARQTLRLCLGYQLFSGSDGWETWLGFVPKGALSVAYDKHVIEAAALRSVGHFKILVQNKLRELVRDGVAKHTLAKNNLQNLSKLRILPDDQDAILKVINQCLNETEVHTQSLEKILVSFRFGDKCRRPLKLPIGRKAAVKKITAHIGVDVAASIPCDEICPCSVFWSKQGLQEIVGCRGTLTTAYGFTECGNFQTTMDGEIVDIKPDLRSVCIYGHSLNFVQLYADTPHRYPSCRFHPVSAAIIVVKGITKNRTHLCADAEHYISEMINNFEQLQDSSCRLEFVAELPDITDVLVAEKLIDERRLCDLLKDHPMLVPFCHERFLSTLCSVGLHLTDSLHDAYVSDRGTGRSKPVWDAFQIELAVEKLLYGRPLCSISRLYSINLGPGVDCPSRSKSDSNGFLCLEDSFACCLDETSHPPLALYSKSEVVQNQIKNTFAVLDSAEGSTAVLGRCLVSTLLKDFHQVGRVYRSFHDFLCSLKLEVRGSARQRVVGGSEIKTLTESISSTKKAKFPMVIGALVSLLKEKGVDVAECLRSGIAQLQLGYFPAFRMSDSQRNAGLFWSWGYGVWVILNLEKRPDKVPALAIFLATAVVSNLESLQLCHASTLMDRTLPWLEPCISKLSEIQLSTEELVTVLTFITCIARLMDGHFIAYQGLSRLERKLPKPIDQRKLQQLEIQSKYLLQKFNKFRLWRLHYSVPYKLEAIEKPISSTSTVQALQEAASESNEVESEEIVPPNRIRKADLDDDVPCQMTAIAIRHVPTNSYRRWSPAELAILADIHNRFNDFELKEQYKEYMKSCLAMEIPDRSVASFTLKLRRL